MSAGTPHDARRFGAAVVDDVVAHMHQAADENELPRLGAQVGP